MDDLDLFQGPVVVVILAAGPGTRFGDSTKQLLPFQGKPLVQHVIDAAVDAGADEVLVVIGHDENAVRGGVTLPDRGHFVLNLDYWDGLSVSLTAGLMAAEPSTEAAVILHADQPEVDPDTIRRVIMTFRETRMPVVRVQYRDKPGPLLLAEPIWDEVKAEAA
jgi:molybdenum cofactor cytidylyltransferase